MYCDTLKLNRSMKRGREMENRLIIRYFIYTYVWAWVLWLPFVLPSFGVYEMTEGLKALITVAVILGAFGPLISAVIITYSIGKLDAVKEFFKRSFNLKTNWKFYVLAILFASITTIIAHYATNILNIDRLPNSLIPNDMGISPIALLIPYTLMIFLVGGGQEEFGWRGFIQIPLQNKVGIINASLMIGLLWSFWHAPLWLIEGEGHSFYPFIAFCLFTTSWSVVIGILYNVSGQKLIIPWIMHTVSNVSVPFFPVLFLEDVPQPGYWVWAIVNIIFAVAVGLWYTMSKKRNIIPT